MIAQTSNFYLQAAKQFCRWMVRDGRATISPIAHLQGLNVKANKHRCRRVLSIDDLRLLIEKTEAGAEEIGIDRQGRVLWSMTGKERAFLYRLAAETGLRAGELRSLTRASFDLDGDPPSVQVLAAYSKRRRNDSQPLRVETAALLKEHFKHLAPATPAFKLPRRENVARMFRADLEAAGILAVDESGNLADFHALRHTFITNLVASGANPKIAQMLAHHSTITLTMDRYTHTYHGDQVAAIQGLPDLSQPSTQAMRATGTNDAVQLPQKAGRETGRDGYENVRSDETAGDKARHGRAQQKTLAIKGFEGNSSGVF